MLKLSVDTPSLAGIPVFLRCGKCLGSRKCEILLAINPESRKALGIPGFASVSEIRIGIQPEMGIWIHGIREGESNSCVHLLSSSQVETKECEGEEGKTGSALPGSSGLKSAYAVLISDVISGRNSSFVREDELVLSWSIFTPLLHDLERSLPPIAYEPGSEGPASALAEDFFYAMQQNESYKERRKLQVRSKL
mmetsp:Transcript_37916/g.60898  ORF Transcript_37916/g.60898 Transcript_37916/m.60898 type:complete len:194 (+) Transcript_37916:138-719(+)